MTNKYIKFISTNLSVMILLLVVLISRYTLIGLISYFIGSGLLFLGTLLDNKKANNGVACKLSFILFITTLTLCGMWLPYILRTKASFEPIGKVNVLGMIIALVLAFIFFVMASAQKFRHYVVRRCLKYSGQAMLFLGVFYFWEMPLNVYPFVVITIFIALLTDLFATKFFIYSSEFDDKDGDKAFWMAFLISLCIIAMNLFYRDYFQRCISKEYLTGIVQEALSGFSVPIFIALMVTLASVFIYLQSKADRYIQHSDSYLVLSLAGFVLMLSVYQANKSIDSFIMLCVAVIAYFIFGFAIPSSDVGSIKNPVYFIIRGHKFRAMVDVVSVLITAISILCIIFAKKGYIVPIIVFACATTIIVVTFIKLNVGWIKINIHWQIVLLSILAFLISVAVVNKNVNNTLPFLAMLFLISTIAIWTLGVRQDVKKYKYSQIAQCCTCIASLGIGMIAVV